MTLRIDQIAPGCSIQDAGRRETLAYGISRGGVADLAALHEGAALLGQSPDHAVLEMAGFGGSFTAQSDCRIALTGAVMQAWIGDRALNWNGSYRLNQGETLRIGAATLGVYGYLSLGGGLDTPRILGSRATYPAQRIGSALSNGDVLPSGPDTGDATNQMLPQPDRFAGGTLRLVPSVQTDRFGDLDRFQATTFTRNPRSNRHGVRLDFDGDPFFADGQLNLTSEVVTPGDVQITGDSTPFILMPDAQTIGGYPRIGTVIPPDMPRVAQAPPGTTFRLTFIDFAQATALHLTWLDELDAIGKHVQPRLRDPASMTDLLSYDLISGITDGTTFR